MITLLIPITAKQEMINSEEERKLLILRLPSNLILIIVMIRETLVICDSTQISYHFRGRPFSLLNDDNRRGRGAKLEGGKLEIGNLCTTLIKQHLLN
jgi:hypothetical protein